MRHRPWVLSAAGNLSVRIAGLSAAIVLARYLGPAGRGVVTEAMLWPTIVLSCFAMMNVQTATFFVSRHGTAGLRECLVLAGKVSLVLLPATMLVNWIALGWQEKASYSIANIYGFIVPATLFSSALAGALLARGRVAEFWVTKTLPGLLTAAGTLVLAVTGRLSPRTFVIGAVLAALATLGWMASRGRDADPDGAPRPSLGREVLGYGATTAFVMLPYQLNLRLDQLMLSVMGSEHALGIYAVATAWSSMLSVVGSGFSMVVLAQSAGAAREDAAVADTLFRKVRLAILLIAGAGLVVGTLAQWGLPFLYGPRFQEAVGPALILCIASVPLYTNIVLHDFTRGMGHPEIGMRPEVVGLGINAVLLFVLLPRFGPIGAAFAALLTYTVVTLFMIPGILRRFPGRSAAALIPNRQDFLDLIASGRSVVGDVRSAIGLGGQG